MTPPIKCIIFDNVRIVLDNIYYLAQFNHPELIVTEIYHKPEIFLSDFSKGNLDFDLLLLRVDMYFFTGIDLLENIENSNIPLNFNIVLLGTFDFNSIKVFNENNIYVLDIPISSKSITEIIKTHQFNKNNIKTSEKIKIISNYLNKKRIELGT